MHEKGTRDVYEPLRRTLLGNIDATGTRLDATESEVAINQFCEKEINFSFDKIGIVNVDIVGEI